MTIFERLFFSSKKKQWPTNEGLILTFSQVCSNFRGALCSAMRVAQGACHSGVKDLDAHTCQRSLKRHVCFSLWNCYTHFPLFYFCPSFSLSLTETAATYFCSCSSAGRALHSTFLINFCGYVVQERGEALCLALPLKPQFSSLYLRPR